MTSKTKQINLKIPGNLYPVVEKYAEEYGFRNIQDLALESMREKIFEKSEFDERLSKEEIKLIDELIKVTINKKQYGTEEELMKALK